MVLLKLRYVLMAVVHVNTESHGKAGSGCLGTREMALPLSSCLMEERPPLQEELAPKAWAATQLPCYCNKPNPLPLAQERWTG